MREDISEEVLEACPPDDIHWASQFSQEEETLHTHWHQGSREALDMCRVVGDGQQKE